jgi:hypothetical protein
LHDIARDYLRTPDYACAYRLAFTNERAEQVQALQVPTLIPRWPDAILLPHTDALLAHALPSHVRSVALQPGHTRYQELAGVIVETLKAEPSLQIAPKTSQVDIASLLTSEIGSAVLTASASPDALALSQGFLHLPGLGLGELASDAIDSEAWLAAAQQWLQQQGASEAAFENLLALHASIEATPALEVLPGNFEFLVHWQALEQAALQRADYAALSPAALHSALLARLDRAKLHAAFVAHRAQAAA